jgi:uncharacterized protein YkwD
LSINLVPFLSENYESILNKMLRILTLTALISGKTIRKITQVLALIKKIKINIFFGTSIVCWSRSPFPDHTDDNFENDIVNAHNYYRQLHGAQALHVDQDVS